MSPIGDILPCPQEAWNRRACCEDAVTEAQRKHIDCPWCNGNKLVRVARESPGTRELEHYTPPEPVE